MPHLQKSIAGGCPHLHVCPGAAKTTAEGWEARLRRAEAKGEGEARARRGAAAAPAQPRRTKQRIKCTTQKASCGAGASQRPLSPSSAAPPALLPGLALRPEPAVEVLESRSLNEELVSAENVVDVQSAHRRDDEVADVAGAADNSVNHLLRKISREEGGGEQEFGGRRQF